MNLTTRRHLVDLQGQPDWLISFPFIWSNRVQSGLILDLVDTGTHRLFRFYKRFGWFSFFITPLFRVPNSNIIIFLWYVLVGSFINPIFCFSLILDHLIKDNLTLTANECERWVKFESAVLISATATKNAASVCIVNRATPRVSLSIFQRKEKVVFYPFGLSTQAELEWIFLNSVNVKSKDELAWTFSGTDM